MANDNKDSLDAVMEALVCSRKEISSACHINCSHKGYCDLCPRQKCLDKINKAIKALKGDMS